MEENSSEDTFQAGCVKEGWCVKEGLITVARTLLLIYWLGPCSPVSDYYAGALHLVLKIISDFVSLTLLSLVLRSLSSETPNEKELLAGVLRFAVVSRCNQQRQSGSASNLSDSDNINYPSTATSSTAAYILENTRRCPRMYLFCRDQ
jgi:hypothetical protein